jgi:ribosome-associated protein
MTKKKTTENKLLKSIIKGIEEKKGFDIVSLDLSKIPSAVCKQFVVCSGSSSTQVEAIADSVLDEVQKATKEKPWHKEGFENKEWILIDFVDTVVHIFQPEVREFYGLEDLWADAEVTAYESEVEQD